MQDVGQDTRTATVATLPELLSAARGGSKLARDQLILLGLPYVTAHARHLASAGVPMDDLIQEGSIAWLGAIDDFAPGQGVDLLTYARQRTRTAMEAAALPDGGAVSLPVEARRKLARLQRADTFLARLLERPATVTEAASSAHLDPRTVKQLRRVEGGPLPLRAADRGVSDCRAFSETDEIVGPTAYRIEDEVIEEVDRAAQRERVLRVLPRLSDRLQAVVRLRAGLYDGPPLGLAEVAKQAGVSKARIAHMESEAVAQLRMILTAAPVRATLPTPPASLTRPSRGHTAWRLTQAIDRAACEVAMGRGIL
jgi:RNA polymerase sigma factor (sigma-70 family)